MESFKESSRRPSSSRHPESASALAERVSLRQSESVLRQKAHKRNLTPRRLPANVPCKILGTQAVAPDPSYDDRSYGASGSAELRGTRASNHLAMNEIELREVAALWMIDGSKNTIGILEAFKDHVERWTEERMTAADVDAFRFIGTVATDRWPTITGGHTVSVMPSTSPQMYSNGDRSGRSSRSVIARMASA
jgi:hypothetical protein